MYLSIHLCTYLSIYVFIYPFIYLSSIYVSIFPFRTKDPLRVVIDNNEFYLSMNLFKITNIKTHGNEKIFIGWKKNHQNYKIGNVRGSIDHYILNCRETCMIFIWCTLNIWYHTVDMIWLTYHIAIWVTVPQVKYFYA